MKDALGMACSGLCICHCVLTPFVLAMGGVGLLGAYLASEWMHGALLAPVLLLALISLPLSLRKHLRWYPLVLAATGVTFLLLGLKLGEALEPYFSVTGAALVLSAHFANRRLLKQVDEQSVAGPLRATA